MARHLSTAFILSLLMAPGMAFAQGGGNETPRPPGSDPSARVNELQGYPPSAPGSRGNPTGTPEGRPAVQPPANAVPARPSHVPGNSRPSDATTSPGAAGSSGTPSPTN